MRGRHPGDSRAQRASWVGRYVTPLALIALGCVVWLRADNTDRADRGLLLDGYAVEVHALPGSDGFHDEFVIYDYRTRSGAVRPRSQWRVVFRDRRAFVREVLPWHAEDGCPQGIAVMSSVAMGRDHHFSVIAEVAPATFRSVLDFDTRGWFGLPGEVVDLDGDDQGEVVLSGERIYDHALGRAVPRTAQAWKWAPGRQRYVMVRESRYDDRLKPLRLKGFR